MARAKMPSLVPGVVNSLIDPVKFPNAFRVTPSNVQWDGAVRTYCKSIMKVTKVAITADATGYGTSAHDDSMVSFKKDGFDIVYNGSSTRLSPTSRPTCCAPATPVPRSSSLDRLVRHGRPP